MYGRYGTDTISKVLMITYSVVVVAFLITNLCFMIFMPNNALASVILYISYMVLSTALIALVFGRIFSRNIVKRRAENQRFVGFFKLWKNRFKDRKTHVYRKCPTCKAVLRLPKAKGKHNVVCPRCKNRFQVRG